jgi:sugar lactone lactonase YvrE
MVRKLIGNNVGISGIYEPNDNVSLVKNINDLSRYIYNDQSNPNIPGVVAISDLHISPDETRIYLTDTTTDRIHQFSLSEFAVTCDFNLKSFPILSQDTTPEGVTIGAAGTAMYIVGSTSDTIYQYSLSTAYDVSTASYSGISFSISARETDPTDLTFSDDGTKVYIIGQTAAGAGVTAGLEYVHQFNLGTAWNVSTAGYSTSFNVRPQTTLPVGLYIGAGGTAMYVNTNTIIYQYTLGTPWEVNTASYTSKSFSVSAQASSTRTIYFKSDGTSVYIVGNSLPILQYSLNTPWDIATASYDSKFFNVTGQETFPTGLYFSPDGTKVFIVGTNSDTVYQYSLTIPWDISTVDFTPSTFVGNLDITPQSLYIKPDGTAAYIVGDNSDRVWTLPLTTPWDIKTAPRLNSFPILSQDTLAQGVTIGAAGTAMYIVGSTSDTIYQYSLSTAYDVSTASYSGISSNISARETDPRDLTFSDDGTKVYVMGFNAAGAGVTAGAEYVHQFNLGTAWNVSTAGYSTSFYITTQTSTAPTGLTIGAGGTAMYVISTTDDTIFQYTLETPWEVNTASYASKSFSVIAQETSAAALYFKSDGTSVYIVGITNNTIYQYSLAIPWDISTSSYDNKSLNVTGQDADHRGLYFSPDGTKVYTIAITNDRVFEYPLTIPWDITSSISNFRVSTQESAPNAISFKPDGTEFYILGTGADTIYQYSLSRPWDVESASYGGKNFNVTGQETLPSGLHFSPDGTKVYIVGSTNDRVFIYPLTTAWDISTAIDPYNIKSFSILSQDTTPEGVTIGAAGTAMYIVGSTSDTIYQYSLSTAYDVSTASYSGISFSISARETLPTDLTFSDDGTKVYIIGRTAAGAGVTAGAEYVHQFNLGTAWNVSTAGYSTSFYITTQTGITPTGLTIGAGGTAMYVIGDTNDTIFQYTLETPWEVNTASYTNKNFFASSQDGLPTALYFKSDGTSVYIVGNTNDRINQYSLTIPWDISTASYDNKSLNVTGQETIPTGLYFSPDGTKVFIVGTNSDTVYQYSLTIPWNLGLNTKSLYVGSEETLPSGVALNNNLDKLYVVGPTSRALYQYDLIN